MQYFIGPPLSAFLAKPQSWGEALRIGVFPPKFPPGHAGPPSPPPAPKTCTVTQTYISGSPAVSGRGRGGGGAAGRTVKTKIIHTNVRRPVQRTPRPQNLHRDPDLQIRQLCGVWGRGGARGGAAGRTPKRKFGKLKIRAWPEPRSQRPGLKLGRQAEQKFLSGHTSFGDQGCSEQCCGKKSLNVW